VSQPTIDRFNSRIDKSGECWLWTGAINGHGYANFRVDGKVVGAHRFSYSYFRGPIPDGLHLDHLCRVRHCVNPAHLEPVDAKTNIYRGELATKIWPARRTKTHCPKGHAYSSWNTYVNERTRNRVCRICHAAACAAWKLSRRASYAVLQ
jgi:hypothetical protein